MSLESLDVVTINPADLIRSDIDTITTSQAAVANVVAEDAFSRAEIFALRDAALQKIVDFGPH